MNCWDYQKCKPVNKDNCPAFLQNKGLDCWKVTGTMCKGVEQGTKAQKIAFCSACNFYNTYAHKF